MSSLSLQLRKERLDQLATVVSNIAESDRLGTLWASGIDMMMALIQNGPTHTSVKRAVESFADLRYVVMQRDSGTYDPFRSANYAFCEALYLMMESMFEWLGVKSESLEEIEEAPLFGEPPCKQPKLEPVDEPYSPNGLEWNGDVKDEIADGADDFIDAPGSITDTTIDMAIEAVTRSKLGVKINRYACDTCDASFVKEENLLRHKLVHSGVKCPICKINLTDAFGLQSHMAFYHSEMSEPPAKKVWRTKNSVKPVLSNFESNVNGFRGVDVPVVRESTEDSFVFGDGQLRRNNVPVIIRTSNDARFNVSCGRTTMGHELLQQANIYRRGVRLFHNGKRISLCAAIRDMPSVKAEEQEKAKIYFDAYGCD